MGEGVKAKDEKLLTCACVRARVEAGGEETRGGVPPTQKNERGIDRKRGLSEKMCGAFSVVGRKRVGWWTIRVLLGQSVFKKHLKKIGCVENRHCLGYELREVGMSIRERQ